MSFLRSLFGGAQQERGIEAAVRRLADARREVARIERELSSSPSLSPENASSPWRDNIFAALDVETTGLFPEHTDRIIEIAVVHLDGDLQVTDEWTTLVNPDRDVGPTSIHHIGARHVRDAPPFEDVVDDVVHRLAGRVVIAHNGSFDERFLRAEFGRLDFSLPPLPIIDTYGLTRLKLTTACHEFGVPHEDAHSALGDTRATAALLRMLLQETRLKTATTLADLGCQRAPSAAEAWPELVYQPTAHGRDASAIASAADVGALALRPGMTICFTGEKAVYASGSLLDRERLTALAERAGFEVRVSVTKKYTDLLVAADPASLSGKAKLARKYGIPIVGHDAFWRAADVDVSVRRYD